MTEATPSLQKSDDTFLWPPAGTGRTFSVILAHGLLMLRLSTSAATDSASNNTKGAT